MPDTGPSNVRVLLLEDDPEVRNHVAAMLTHEGYHVVPVDVRKETLQAVDGRHHDVVLVSLEGIRLGGDTWIHEIRNRLGGLPVLVLADSREVQQAVEAMRHGAEDYLLRPPDPTELRMRLGRILERRDLSSRIAFFQNELSKKAVFKDAEVRSPAMRGLLERIMRVAPMRSTVLITGESGVGKELVARAIHFNSPRRNEAFIALNCAAMPANLIESDLFGHEKGAFTGAHARARGKFEIANRGTLFLDEIGEMAPATQAKLLRVLEEKEFMRIGGDRSIRVDVRVIAATNANLEDMVARNLLRRDLYYRLKVISIRVPPLRERKEDIPQLVETFLDQLSRANAIPNKAISPDAVVALQAYNWPGNVRELKNLLESVLVSSVDSIIDTGSLPRSIHRRSESGASPDPGAGTTLEEMERMLIRRTLEHTGGNRTHSASLLGIGVRTLQRKIRAYGIDIAPTRRRPRRKKRVRGSGE
jgi:DNA-binding NtrC family response regulator